MRRLLFLLVLALTVLAPAASADDAQVQEMKDQITTIQQAADELRPTDPQLADKLQQMVDKKKQKLAQKESL